MSESGSHNSISQRSVSQGFSEVQPGADAIAPIGISDHEAFVSTRRAIRELEAIGVTDFQFFNALADLYHQRRESEVSALMAEAAYQVFLRD